MSLPNYLNVGFMKAGTSTLRTYLAQHRQVFVAPREIHFFSRDGFFDRGIGWYEEQFRAATGETAVGEKSPSYAYHRSAPDRIFKHLPGVKLIWLFREPVARTYSNYWHSWKRGHELLDFDTVVQRELRTAREHPTGLVAEGCLQRSNYVEPLDRFLACFPKEQMLFLLFENLVRDPQSTMAEVFDFLGVSADSEISPLPAETTTYLPRNVRLESAARRLLNRTRLEQLYTLVHLANRRPAPGYPPMREETRLLLKMHFEPQVRRLEELTGQDRSLWGST